MSSADLRTTGRGATSAASRKANSRPASGSQATCGITPHHRSSSKKLAVDSPTIWAAHGSTPAPASTPTGAVTTHSLTRFDPTDHRRRTSTLPPTAGSASLGPDQSQQRRIRLLEVVVGRNEAGFHPTAADVLDLIDRSANNLVDVGVRDVDLGVGRGG